MSLEKEMIQGWPWQPASSNLDGSNQKRRRHSCTSLSFIKFFLLRGWPHFEASKHQTNGHQLIRVGKTSLSLGLEWDKNLLESWNKNSMWWPKPVPPTRLLWVFKTWRPQAPLFQKQKSLPRPPFWNLWNFWMVARLQISTNPGTPLYLTNLVAFPRPATVPGLPNFIP